MSSERVSSGRNGRIVTGASVCPMKMLAATFSDSAPLAPMMRHQPGGDADDELHDADVIQNREQRADEDDDRQHLKSEDEPDAGTLLAQRSEDEFRADEGVAEHLVGRVSNRLKSTAAVLDPQNEDREGKLQAQAPGHRLDADGAPVAREHKRQAQHAQKAKNSGESSHSVSLPGFGDDAMDQRSTMLRSRRRDGEFLQQQGLGLLCQ